MGTMLRLVIGYFLARGATRRTGAGGAPFWFGLLRMFGLRRAVPIAVVLSVAQYLFRRRKSAAGWPAPTRRPALPGGPSRLGPPSRSVAH